MSVYLLTKKDQLKVCVELAAYMERTSSEVTIFTDSSDFYASIDTAPPGQLEYVMIDVRTFQMDLFSPYKYIAECKNPVPVVVYNDPYPDPESRAAYWYVKNKKYLVPYVNENKLENLIPAFSLIELYFYKYQFSKYVSVISAPEEFYTKEEIKKKVVLNEFATRHKLAKSRKELFDFFLKNEGVEVKEEDICLALWKEVSQKTKQTLYTYISEIRKACRNEHDIHIDILRISKGIYQMNVSCDLPNGCSS
ncbi:MAG: hypothetical protein KBS64_06775 [Treponema sp.]|nr:hypothetical protein [Candidatus Treponema equi]